MKQAQALSDLTWLKHLMTGQVLEEFSFEGYRTVAVRIPTTARSAVNQFHLRMLFFPAGSSRPVLCVNLESSILGEYLLTLQSGGTHRTLGSVSEPLSYPDFKGRALMAARQELRSAAP